MPGPVTSIRLSLTDAVFQYGTVGTATLTAPTRDNSVADVSLKCTVGEAKANTRNSRHEMSLPSMFVDEIEVSIPSDANSGAMTALISAFTNVAPIPVYVSDGTASAGAAAIGLKMVAGVFGWDDTQTLNEVPVNKFTLKPYAVGANGPFPQFA